MFQPQLSEKTEYALGKLRCSTHRPQKNICFFMKALVFQPQASEKKDVLEENLFFSASSLRKQQLEKTMFSSPRLQPQKTIIQKNLRFSGPGLSKTCCSRRKSNVFQAQASGEKSTNHSLGNQCVPTPCRKRNV